MRNCSALRRNKGLTEQNAAASAAFSAASAAASVAADRSHGLGIRALSPIISTMPAVMSAKGAGCKPPTSSSPSFDLRGRCTPLGFTRFTY